MYITTAEKQILKEFYIFKELAPKIFVYDFFNLKYICLLFTYEHLNENRNYAFFITDDYKLKALSPRIELITLFGQLTSLYKCLL